MIRGTDNNWLRLHYPAKASRPRPDTAPRPNWNDTNGPGGNGADTCRASAYPGPARPRPREPIAVLADVLERDGSELSASEDQATQPGQR